MKRYEVLEEAISGDGFYNLKLLEDNNTIEILGDGLPIEIDSEALFRVVNWIKYVRSIQNKEGSNEV